MSLLFVRRLSSKCFTNECQASYVSGPNKCLTAKSHDFVRSFKSKFTLATLMPFKSDGLSWNQHNFVPRYSINTSSGQL